MKRGFTLIELLFVLGVLAILAALTIPSIRGIQDESRLARIQADLAVLQSATEAYRNRFGTWPSEADYQKELIEKTGIFTNRLIDPLTKEEYIFRSVGRYYAVLSPGLNREINTVLDFNAGTFTAVADDLIVTNLRELK